LASYDAAGLLVLATHADNFVGISSVLGDKSVVCY